MSEPSTATVSRAKRDLQQQLRQPRAAGCGGEGCVARNPWPLHHVRHRGVFRQLCTSCVLRCHPGSFCTNCFELFGGAGCGPRPHPAVVHCASCPSVSHTACLPNREQASDYLCPCCVNPNGFLYFSVDGDDNGEGNQQQQQELDGWRNRKMDPESSKVLLAAAWLASASLSRAVAASKIEAERKVKEAMVAGKRANEMLERALYAAKSERERRKWSVSEVVVADSKKKKTTTPKTGGAVVVAVTAQKQIQSREREKLMKIQNPIPLAQRSPIKPIMRNHTSSLPHHVKQEEVGINGILPASSKASVIAENERGAQKAPAKLELGPRMPPPNRGDC